MSETPTDYEQRGRIRKATKIVDQLQALNFRAEQAAQFPDDAKLYVAQLAGVRPASGTTWAMVVHLMEWREKQPGYEDPFADLPRTAA
jgi:hypothetical protein